MIAFILLEFEMFLHFCCLEQKRCGTLYKIRRRQKISTETIFVMFVALQWQVGQKKFKFQIG